MKSLFLAVALSFALTFSVTTSAAETQVATANQAMPVLYQAVKNGPTYPVLAKKDGQYFQVFVFAKGQPYFTDAAGKWHFVASTNENAESFPVYYVSGNSSEPIAMPEGKSDEEAKDILASGNGKVKDSVVCWGGRGWYGYGYVSYRNYCYYPSYSYGYGCGYGGGYGYGGGSYYGGYYGGGYYGYGYGYYGYGRANYYSGYGCVMNNWYW